MDKQYPTDNKMMFLMCDAIRKEQGNKLALLGVYLGGDIIIEVEPPITLSSLSILFHFNDGYGDFKPHFEIINEDDEKVLEITAKETKKLDGVGMTAGFSIGNMTFKKFGDYKFRLNLDDQVYERTVNVHKGKVTS